MIDHHKSYEKKRKRVDAYLESELYVGRHDRISHSCTFEEGSFLA